MICHAGLIGLSVHFHVYKKLMGKFDSLYEKDTGTPKLYKQKQSFNNIV